MFAISIVDIDNNQTILDKDYLSDLYSEWVELDEKVAVHDANLSAICKQSAKCMRLLHVPDIGPLSAAAIAATANQTQEFKNRQESFAWLNRNRAKTSTAYTILFTIQRTQNFTIRSIDMKKLIAVTALIAYLATFQTAFAKAQTANDFLRWFEEVQLAYIMGYWNAYVLLMASNNEQVPDGVTYSKLRDAFRKWIREHPEKKNENLGEISIEIFGSLFPIRRLHPSNKWPQ